MQRDEETEKFNKVYDEVFPLLIKISFHMTGDMAVAEDLCQEAFIRYYERTSAFPNTQQAKYWLIRVLKNLTLNHEKRKKREMKAYQKYAMEPQKPEESGEEQYLKSEAKEIVQKALEKLPDKLKTSLVLREYGRLSYKEIGGILKISEANVKVRVFRAREMIGTMIKQGEVYVP